MAAMGRPFSVWRRVEKEQRQKRLKATAKGVLEKRQYALGCRHAGARKGTEMRVASQFLSPLRWPASPFS